MDKHFYGACIIYFNNRIILPVFIPVAGEKAGRPENSKNIFNSNAALAGTQTDH